MQDFEVTVEELMPRNDDPMYLAMDANVDDILGEDDLEIVAEDALTDTREYALRNSTPPPVPAVAARVAASSAPPPLPHLRQSSPGQFSGVTHGSSPGFLLPRSESLPPSSPRAILEARRTLPVRSSITPDSTVSEFPGAEPATNPRDNFRRIERLRQELRGVRAIQAKHERDLQSVRAAFETLTHRVDLLESSSPPGALEDRLSRIGMRVFQLEMKKSTGTKETGKDSGAAQGLTDELAALMSRIERLEAGHRVAPVTAAPDDLTQIPGIGPKFAASLRSLGVTRFVDVARWTPEDVRNIAKELGIKPQRIDRAAWIEGAKKLAKFTESIVDVESPDFAAATDDSNA